MINANFEISEEVEQRVLKCVIESLTTDVVKLQCLADDLFRKRDYVGWEALMNRAGRLGSWRSYRELMWKFKYAVIEGLEQSFPEHRKELLEYLGKATLYFGKFISSKDLDEETLASLPSEKAELRAVVDAFAFRTNPKLPEVEHHTSQGWELLFRVRQHEPDAVLGLVPYALNECQLTSAAIVVKDNEAFVYIAPSLMWLSDCISINATAEWVKDEKSKLKEFVISKSRSYKIDYRMEMIISLSCLDKHGTTKLSYINFPMTGNIAIKLNLKDVARWHFRSMSDGIELIANQKSTTL